MMHPRSRSFPTHSSAEGREDHHVLLVQILEPLVRPPVEALGEELDAHLPEPGVHGGVVDHVPRQEDPAVRELLPGLEGVVHGPVHPVAEAELVGEAQGEVPGLEHVVAAPDLVDDLGAVVPVQQVLHLPPHLEAPAEIPLLLHASPLA